MRSASKSSSTVTLSELSQCAVYIVTIFKDDRRVATNLGKLDIKIVGEAEFAVNDAFHIIKRMLWKVVHLSRTLEAWKKRWRTLEEAFECFRRSVIGNSRINGDLPFSPLL
jgi:hypothetical protein